MQGLAANLARERLIDLLNHPEDWLALVTRTKSFTFGALRSRALAFAAALVDRGLGRGDYIAVMLPNNEQWLSVMFGASAAGVAVVSINIRLGGKELGEMVALTGAKALAYDSDTLGGGCLATLALVPEAHMASIRTIFRSGPAEKQYRTPPAEVVDLDAVTDALTVEPVDSHPGCGADSCFIIPTSGTTGRPKLVVHIQERIVRHSRDVARVGDFTRGTSSLATMPFSGAYGFTLLMGALAGGQTVVLSESFDPIESTTLLQHHEITHMGGTNDMIFRMLQSTDEPRPFPALRHFVHANFTPSLSEMPREAERRGVHIRGGYGASEILAMFAMQPNDASLAERAESGGFLVNADADFRVIDPETGKKLADGEIGELEVLAPNGMIGYFDNENANNAARTSDGYLRTGDLGYRLPDGRMQFETRANDVLRIAGYLVSPAEIEECILQLDGLTACQVVAVRQDLSVRPVAFVISAANAPTDAAIIDTCRARLAKYKVPIRVFRVDEFPSINGPNGKKVKRNHLRDLALAIMSKDNLHNG